MLITSTGDVLYNNGDGGAPAVMVVVSSGPEQDREWAEALIRGELPSSEDAPC
jgi:hypothetical protein